MFSCRNLALASDLKLPSTVYFQHPPPIESKMMRHHSAYHLKLRLGNDYSTYAHFAEMSKSDLPRGIFKWTLMRA